MTGAGFASGAAVAGLNEIVQKELAKLKDPSLHQIASGIIGAAAGSTAGAATAVSGTRNNTLTLIQILDEAILIREGAAIVFAGVIYEAGSWLYEKYHYLKADIDYPPSDNHSTTADGNGFKTKGNPNSCTLHKA